MTKTAGEPTALIRPLRGRDPSEHHRAATPLELLYDLVLVIAIAAAASGLHHSVAEDHFVQGIGVYLFVFWALWWPWVNFTWFASAFDNDDAVYRCLVFIQMIGALLTAAGIQMFATAGVTPLMLIGYIVMRIAMVAAWLRAGRDNPEHRASTTRYALGIALCQMAWVGVFFLAPREHFMLISLPVMAAEMAVPAFAERASPTPWHRDHIIERYGLLTIIVLGESLLSAANAITALAGHDTANPDLWITLGASFLILFTMWWIYFGERYHGALDRMRTAFAWGYSHYFVYASVAAVGAGIAVLVDQITHHAEISRTVANAAVSLPVALYLLSVWFAHDCVAGATVHRLWQLPAFAALVLLTPLVEQGVTLTGLLLLGCLAFRLRDDAKAA